MQSLVFDRKGNMDENLQVIADLHDEVEMLTLMLQNANTYALMLLEELRKLKELKNVQTDK